jgi:cytidylate kinase
VGVVTFSRQYGAGGMRVAPAVAEALGYRFVDRELVDLAAKRLGVDPAVAESRDERVPALLEQLGRTLATAAPEFGPGPPPELDDRAMAAAVREVILSLAEAGGYVILGRGAQAALAGRADVCSISLVGDRADRVRRVMEWQGIDEREARSRCDQVDGDRAGYVRRFLDADIRDPSLYDCILNTSRLDLASATAIAVHVARRKLHPE